MPEDHDTTIPQAQESFEVDYFRPEDAAGIVRLFRAVYGEHYPIRFFYDPGAIIAANAEGRYYSIVARTTSGMVIGVTHLYHSAPCQVLYETGVGLVLKEYRNTGINKRLLGFLYEEFVPPKPHIEELFAEAVCNHPFMQKVLGLYRFIETAIEVALMPAGAYTKEQSAPGRVATLDVFRCYQSKPHRIFLPAAYEQELRWIYLRLDDVRDIELSSGKTPSGLASKAELIVFEFAQVARIAVHEIGEDFRDCLDGLEKQAEAGKAVVFQVFLKLSLPWVGEAVDILREKGYFFGGALPRWFDGDGLLMQKLICRPDFDDIVLGSDRAKRLLEIIRQDWKRASGR